MSPRRAILQGLGVICALCLGFGLWAAFAPLEGALVLAARLEASGGRLLIQSPQSGRLALITVSEGQEVAAGAILAEIDMSDYRLELGAVTRELASIQARAQRIEAELKGPAKGQDDALQQALQDIHHALRDEENALYDRQTAQVQESLRGISAQSAAVSRQLALISQERETQEGLYQRGLAQIGPLLALQREEARLIGQNGELAAAKAAAQQKRSEIAHQRQRTRLQERERLLQESQDLARRRAELEARQALLQHRLEQRFLRAPVAGVIFGLRARSHLEAGEALCELLPKAAEILALVEVPPQYIAEVHLGQRVKLLPLISPAKGQEPLYGALRTLSPDLYHPREGHAYFRAEIALEGAAPPDLPLGTGFQAYVTRGARSPLRWLIAPLADYFRPALRES